MNELAAAEANGTLTDKQREKLLYPGRVMLTSESFVSLRFGLVVCLGGWEIAIVFSSIGVGCAWYVCRCGVGVILLRMV